MMRTGGCQCGKVRFEVTGEPMNQVFCYCTDCQQRTGGDKWFGVWYGHDQFNYTGEIATQVHTRTGSSGADVHHHYCPECGVNVYVDITVANFYTIAGPAFDDQAGLKRRMAIFTRNAADWAVLPDDMPVYETFPNM